VTIEIEPHIVFADPQGIFDTPGNEWLAFIKDSEGNLVGLMSREKI
jgi:methylmalonyl-CoA/ethylmalonyl-CoA epimerase